MKLAIIKCITAAFLASLIAACTTAKLEARLEANPQCKEIINPKTGALMPCPGSDKAFYRSVGLETPKPQTASSVAPAAEMNSKPVSEPTAPTVKQSQVSTPTASSDCKPSLHKKTGNILPCPSPD